MKNELLILVNVILMMINAVITKVVVGWLGLPITFDYALLVVAVCRLARLSVKVKELDDPINAEIE